MAPNHMQCECQSEQLTAASLDALGPSVVKVHITDISTVLEPSTTASTTAALANLVGNAFGTPAIATTFDTPGIAAFRRWPHRRVCFCWNASINTA